MATNRDNFKVCPCLFVKFCQQQRTWFRSHPGSPNLNTRAFWSQGTEIEKLFQCVLVPNRLLQYVLFITCLLFYTVFLLLPSGLYRAFMLQWKNACPRLPRPCLPSRCYHGAERRPGGRTRSGRSAVSASSAGGTAVCRGWGGVLHHFNVQKHRSRATDMVIFTKKIMKILFKSATSKAWYISKSLQLAVPDWVRRWCAWWCGDPGFEVDGMCGDCSMGASQKVKLNLPQTFFGTSFPTVHHCPIAGNLFFFSELEVDLTTVFNPNGGSGALLLSLKRGMIIIRGNLYIPN